MANYPRSFALRKPGKCPDATNSERLCSGLQLFSSIECVHPQSLNYFTPVGAFRIENSA